MTTSKNYKITVMGSAGVGKSCIISRFLYDSFMTEYQETIEDLHRGEYVMTGSKLTLDILDTAGAYSFPAMRRLAISTSDAFVLVYAFGVENSKEEVKRLREEILATKEYKHCPIVIVKNKSDMSDAYNQADDAMISIPRGKGYIEASAKDNINIVEIFKETLRQCNYGHALSPAIRKRQETSRRLKTKNNKTAHARIIS